MEYLLANYMFLIGFIYAATIAVPISYLGIRSFEFVSTFSKRIMYAVLIVVSTILSSHLTNILDFSLLLILSSAAIFMALLSEYNKASHTVGVFMILISTAYYLSHFDSYTRLYIAGSIFALITLSIKLNPQRNTIRALNPYIVFMIITTIPEEHLMVFFSKLPFLIMATCFLRILYCYLMKRMYLVQHIIEPILSLNKFYLISWLITYLVTNPHILQVL